MGRLRAEGDHVASMEALVTLNQFVVYHLAVCQDTVTLAGNKRVMNEYILAFVTNNETETLFRIEPFYLAYWHLIISLKPVALNDCQ